MKKNKMRRMVAECIAALVWTALTMLTDRLIFRYDWRDGTVFAYKVLFFFLVFGLLHGAVTLAGKLRRRERFACRCVRWALPYLAVNLLILLLIWPGAWGNDDLYVLDMARSLQLTPWYHYLSSVYQILVLMLLPFMSGTVVVQIFVISGMTGYLMALVQETAEGYCAARGWDTKFARCTAILYLPLVLPPVLLHNQEAFRPTWTSWTEIFLLAVVALWFSGHQPLSRGKWWTLICLGALTATWRSECIYYVILVPVFLLLFARSKQLGLQSALVGSVLVIVLTLVSNRYNNSLQGGSDWSYQSVAFSRQIVTVVQASDLEKDADLLEKIDPVFSVQACKDYMGTVSGAYEQVVRDADTVTQEKWNECLKASLLLAFRYPDAVFKERWELFINTVHYTIFSGQKSVFITSSELYDRAPEELRSIQKNFLENMPPLAEPINQELRRQVMNVLMDWKVDSNRIVSLSWNMLPFFVVLFVMQIVLAIWRKWMLYWVNMAGVLHIAVVFVAAPTGYFMYYLAPYMQGAITATIVVLWMVLRALINCGKSKVRGI